MAITKYGTNIATTIQKYRLQTNPESHKSDKFLWVLSAHGLFPMAARALKSAPIAQGSFIIN